MKIAICKSNASHDSFLVNVTVVQQWSVDHEGDQLESIVNETAPPAAGPSQETP